MKCVRCIEGDVEVVAVAPDGSGAWEIYHCVLCNYGWRNTEPPAVTDPACRDPFFQLDPADIPDLMSPLTVPESTRPKSSGPPAGPAATAG
jgi:vanillate/4-hydroxybenzoate decarboxylase subunit D